jgi:hypothetical protein
VATFALISIAIIARAATPEVVLNDPAVDEGTSSASAGYLVWSANSEARPNRYHSYVMADGGSPVRVDPVGAQSFGAAIDGTTIVYQESTSEGDDLWFFDAVTEERSAPPAGVNTANLEYRPTLSGDWLLFTRTNLNRESPGPSPWLKVVLFNLSTSTRIVLRKLPLLSTSLVSDQVNGDWATFESCRVSQHGESSDCQVFRYQISTEELVEIANPGVQQYAGAVSGDGTVYLVRTRNRDFHNCGDHSKLVRYPVGGPGVVIATLPDGRDARTTFALDETGGSTTMYFDRLACRKGRSGIYRIPDADTAGP